jgi:hypothetical protein
MSPRARQADVEQPALLRNRGFGLRLARRQLARLDVRDEDGVELESLLPVQRQQMDSAA